NGVTSQRINEFKISSDEQIKYLLETLKNFRTFFRPAKNKKLFSIKDTIDSVLNLLSDELIRYSINVQVDAEEDFSILGNENEFKHILLNLFNNSKYAFLENKIKDRKIIINILKKEKKLEYIDNAGGIKEEMLCNLFEMHSSTKGEDGSGIGLYISQQIAYKHNGELIAKNINDGSKFIFLYKG
ncbi:MAG: HAMP domain-containing histidine kinase, partial [Epsilonproteobacteria bacterium]|nr:HAMP domain-containing histidine kinase [Campylobacterota bacterium]